jgi:hypothetical protein
MLRVPQHRKVRSADMPFRCTYCCQYTLEEITLLLFAHIPCACLSDSGHSQSFFFVTGVKPFCLAIH